MEQWTCFPSLSNVFQSKTTCLKPAQQFYFCHCWHMHIILHLTVKLHYCVKFCSTDVEVVALGTPLKKGVSLGPTNFFPINTNLGSRIEVLVIRARNPPDVVLPEYKSKSGPGIVNPSLGQIGSLLPKSVSNKKAKSFCRYSHAYNQSDTRGVQVLSGEDSSGTLPSGPQRGGGQERVGKVQFLLRHWVCAAGGLILSQGGPAKGDSTWRIGTKDDHCICWDCIWQQGQVVLIASNNYLASSLTCIWNNAFSLHTRRFPLDCDEVSLRRIVGSKKDQLFLNGRAASSKTEVRSSLEAAGFSCSNPYYVVRQGQINKVNKFRIHMFKSCICDV